MHIHTLEHWQHSHDFSEDRSHAEKNTKIVMLFTAATMVAEIAAGTIFGSMALLADGWHMATHVAAFGITILLISTLANMQLTPNTHLEPERSVCLVALLVRLPLPSLLF